MNGLTTSETFVALRNRSEPPTITITRNEVPHAILTSGARSIERKVASASALACSARRECGVRGKRVPAFVGIVGSARDSNGFCLAAIFPPPDSRDKIAACSDTRDANRARRGRKHPKGAEQRGKRASFSESLRADREPTAAEYIFARRGVD